MFGAPGGAWGAPGGAWAPGSSGTQQQSNGDSGGSYNVWGLPQPVGQQKGSVGAIGALGGGAWGAPSLPVKPIGSSSAAAGLPPPPAVQVGSTAQQVVAPGAPAVLPTAPPSSVAAAAPTLPSAAAPASGGGLHVVKCKGLPLSATIEKIEQFFDGLEIADAGVQIRTNEQGLPSGECLVQFVTEEALSAALEKNRQVMGHRYVTIERAGAADSARAFRPPAPAPARQEPPPAKQAASTAAAGAASGAGGASACSVSVGGGGGHSCGGGARATAQVGTASSSSGSAAPAHAHGSGRGSGAPSSRAASRESHASERGGASARGHDEGGSSSSNIVIKMRGLPYSTTEVEIGTFFAGLHIVDGGVSIGRDASGRASGEAHVEFASEQDAQSAMLLNRRRIGARYIELFRTKQAPPSARRAIAASSSDPNAGTVDCLRLRGMPFNSTETDVYTFFKGYSITSGGVKLGPQVGQATVKFSSSDDARRALVNLNHSYMGSRYIELFYATP